MLLNIVLIIHGCSVNLFPLSRLEENLDFKLQISSPLQCASPITRISFLQEKIHSINQAFI